MQYKKLGSKRFFKVGAPHQLSVTVDRNTARTPQLFIVPPLASSTTYES